MSTHHVAGASSTTDAVHVVVDVVRHCMHVTRLNAETTTELVGEVTQVSAKRATTQSRACDVSYCRS